ncbi:MAG: hypothetical protein GTN65_06525 [Armatimonadetes bacterium]|nr:hypothetical protein [Armatimonadota bacterium]NIO96744.1 hypothetical protein [Armatimonadota bacterium]
MIAVVRYAKDRDYQNLDNNSDSAILGLRLTVSPQEALELVVLKTDTLDSFGTAHAYGLQYYRAVAEDNLLALRAIVSEFPSDSTSGLDSNREFRIDFAFTKQI